MATPNGINAGLLAQLKREVAQNTPPSDTASFNTPHGSTLQESPSGIVDTYNLQPRELIDQRNQVREQCAADAVASVVPTGAEINKIYGNPTIAATTDTGTGMAVSLSINNEVRLNVAVQQGGSQSTVSSWTFDKSSPVATVGGTPAEQKLTKENAVKVAGRFKSCLAKNMP